MDVFGAEFRDKLVAHNQRHYIDVVLLGPNVAQVVTGCSRRGENIIHDLLRPNDIVRLSHDPNECDTRPEVVETLFEASPRRYSSLVEFGDDQSMYLLIAIAEILGGVDS